MTFPAILEATGNTISAWAGFVTALLVAYIDGNGVPKDVMFDSFLFLYNNAAFPSGGLPYKNNTKSDWEWVLSDLFEDGSNIKALNEAAGQVKESLGLSDDFKYKVTMTIYYPTKDFENFGDIDNDYIIGKVAFRLLPFGNWKVNIEYDY